VFVNKEYQLDWMVAVGARERGALEPAEARSRGGARSGAQVRDSGMLLQVSAKGGLRSREIARRMRRLRSALA
jgi:hypothetical protein